MKLKIFFLIVSCCFLMTACNLPSNAAPTEVFTEEAPTASMDVLPTGTTVLETAIPAMTNTAASAPARGVFTLSILVDTTSEPVTREQAQVLVDEASAIFERLTGFTLEMVDFREYNSGMSSILGNYFNDPAYVRSDGIIIFSYGDNGDARLYGGYAFEVPGPSGFVSRFNSPYTDPNSVYVSVVHFSHRFAVCGYGGNEEPISDVSVGGECFNQPGTACVEKYGYQMCSTAVDDLYASTQTYMASSTFVHEIMHSFGESGAEDHYFTPQCTEKMKNGISQRPYQSEYFDRVEGNLYVQMCPYVFDVFASSYRP